MSSPASAAAMQAELLKLMKVRVGGDWGPDPLVCRWCKTWLEYTDSSPGKPPGLHTPDCFAVLHLGQPARGSRT